MAGTSWPDLTAGKKAKASEVESKFDWSEGDVVPHSAGTLANNTYTLGVHSAGTFYYWKAGYVMALNPTTTAQGIAIGKDSAQSSASLDLSAMPKALIVPFLTTTQRDALSATSGMFLFNTTANRFERYEGGQWSAMNQPIGLKLKIYSSNNWSSQVSQTLLTYAGSGQLIGFYCNGEGDATASVAISIDSAPTATITQITAAKYLNFSGDIGGETYAMTTAVTYIRAQFKSSLDLSFWYAGPGSATVTAWAIYEGSI